MRYGGMEKLQKNTTIRPCPQSLDQRSNIYRKTKNGMLERLRSRVVYEMRKILKKCCKKVRAQPGDGLNPLSPG